MVAPFRLNMNTNEVSNHNATKAAGLHGIPWSIFVPAALFVLYAFLSVPMMYPGFDIWIHLASINSDGTVWQKIWHLFWHKIFFGLDITNPFAQAKTIHTTQLLLTFFLLWAGSRWILKLAFAGLHVKASHFNLAAWLAVLMWALMHGTVSAAINASTPVWYSWLLWYSVNYQITLPMYVFAVGAFLWGCFGGSVIGETVRSWPYFAVALAATFAIAMLHAGEMPYVLFSLVLIGLLWFSWKWKWRYAIGVALVVGLLCLGLYGSHRLPTGLAVFQEKGFSGLLQTIATYGQHLIQGLNRGNASWHYWYWVNLVLALCTLGFMFSFARGQHRALNLRIAAFVALSAIPAAMVHWKWSAGLLGMITYPALASRFSFSSFLFLALPMALLLTGLSRPKWSSTYHLGGLAIVVVGTVLLASKHTETNQVSYNYAKSLALSLSSSHMRFGLNTEQQTWLDTVHHALLTTPPSKPPCTDMFTAYYLYFVKGYDRVVLPDRANFAVPAERRVLEAGCVFPADGGDIKALGVDPLPWTR